MPTIIAILNQKGGTGKTTTCVTLGHGLALTGRKVLLVDLDAQGNIADLLGMRKHGGMYELLCGNPDIAILGTGRENLDVILGDHTTFKAKQELAGHHLREYRLRRELEKCTGWEYILLDVAPSFDLLQVSALVACHYFLIPVLLDSLAINSAREAIETTHSLQQLGAFDGQFLGVLPTQWERVTKVSEAQLKTLTEQYKHLVWPPIPVDTKVREAAEKHWTIWEFAPGTPALKGRRAWTQKDGEIYIGGYQAVLSRLIRETK